jgi:hypothetical protein
MDNNYEKNEYKYKFQNKNTQTNISIMSSANALAKQRRAGITTPQPQIPQQQRVLPGQQQFSGQPQQPQGPNVNTPGLTLPQVIALVDTRLITLEKFMKETKESQQQQNQSQSQSQDQSEVQQQPSSDFVEEIQNRFDMLASEILDLKDIVLKLQAYTMDVNKTLLEERIHILSEVEDRSEPQPIPAEEKQE